MADAVAKFVVIRPDNETSFRKRLAQVRDQIRKRAFELYCKRADGGADKTDWLQAERETVLSHIVAVEDNVRDIRITAAVPDIDPSHLVVDVLPARLWSKASPPKAPRRSGIRCSLCTTTSTRPQ